MFSSSEMIILSGDRAQVVNLTVQKTMFAEEFLRNIDIKKESFDTPLLPPGTIYYRCAKNAGGYVIEGGPRVCSFKSQLPEYAGLVFQVPIPWHVFIVRVDLESGFIRSSYLFFTKGPIKSIDAQLYHTWLGNQYHERDGSLCLGHDDDTHRIEVGNSETPIRRRIQMLISHVYSSAFNNSLLIPKSFVPKELQAIPANKLDGEEMHRNYYAIAAGVENPHKWLALSHIYFMRNYRSMNEWDMGKEFGEWTMRPSSTLAELISKRIG